MLTLPHPRLLLALLATLGLAVGPAAVGDDYHVRPQADEALIVNTGSTNTTGYSLYVQPTGRVRYTVTGRANTSMDVHLLNGHVTKAQASKFFRDLWASMPLTELPAGHGMKSVSFGTSTFVAFKGLRSPDLSAPADARGKALHDDITQIAAALHLKNTPRRPLSGGVPVMLPGH